MPSLSISTLGRGILESHEATTIALLINQECWNMSKDPHVMLGPLHGRKQIVEYLNQEDHFHTLLLRCAVEAGKRLGIRWSDRGTIYLGAYAMELGVMIDQKDMECIRSALERTEVYSEAEARILKSCYLPGINREVERGFLGRRDSPGYRPWPLFPEAETQMRSALRLYHNEDGIRRWDFENSALDHFEESVLGTATCSEPST